MWYPRDIVELAVVASAFLLVLLLWCGGVWAWSLRRRSKVEKVERRLGLGVKDAGATRVLRLWYAGREVTTAVQGQRRRPSVRDRLERLRVDAGWRPSLGRILLGVLGTAVVVFLFTSVITGEALIGLGVVATLLTIIWVYLKLCIGRRVATFEAQLVDALELAARSLRAGHPLTGAFRLVSEEISAPVGPLFADICQQQALGIGLDEALRDVTAATTSSDMRLFATSVIIQIRSGGNLADMMERVAAVTRDRMKLSRHIRVAIAQTQVSKRILSGMPFVLFLLLNVVRRDYMTPLYTTPLGRTLLISAGVSLLLGVWVMRRMAVVKF